MIKLLILILVCLAYPLSVNTHAATVKNPINNFIENLHGSPGMKPTGWVINKNAPEGGYLFRFSLDIMGDETPELFIGSSMTHRWDVYEHKSEGGYVKANDYGLHLGGSLRFGYKKNGTDGKIMYLLRHDNPGNTKYIVTTYFFDKLGYVKSKRKDYSRQLAREDNRRLGLEEVIAELDFGSIKEPAVEKVLLKKYQLNPETAWRTFKRRLKTYNQHEDKADEADINSLITWESRLRRNWREWINGVLFLILLGVGCASLIPMNVKNKNNTWALFLPVYTVALYLIYEWSVSPHINIRIDLLFFYPMLLASFIVGIYRLVQYYKS